MITKPRPKPLSGPNEKKNIKQKLNMFLPYRGEGL